MEDNKNKNELMEHTKIELIDKALLKHVAGANSDECEPGCGCGDYCMQWSA